MLDEIINNETLPTLEDLWTEFVAKHAEMQAEIPQLVMRWSNERNISVKHKSDNLLCIEFAEYAYLGGAHPNSRTTFVSYRMQQGEELALDHLFIDGYQETLLQIAEDAFRELKGIDPGQSLNEQVTEVIVTIIVALSSIILSSVLVNILVTDSITKPIRMLCDKTAMVAKGDFKTRTTCENHDELSILSDSFNDMASKLEQQVQSIRLEQENLRHMESKLLQTQINPHFLYNTLDTIIWLIEGDKNIGRGVPQDIEGVFYVVADGLSYKPYVLVQALGENEWANIAIVQTRNQTELSDAVAIDVDEPTEKKLAEQKRAIYLSEEERGLCMLPTAIFGGNNANLADLWLDSSSLGAIFSTCSLQKNVLIALTRSGLTSNFIFV